MEKDLNKVLLGSLLRALYDSSFKAHWTYLWLGEETGWEVEVLWLGRAGQLQQGHPGPVQHVPRAEPPWGNSMHY